MKYFYNVNRSGKALKASGSAVPGIIPSDPSLDLLSGELLIMDYVGHVCSVEEAVQMIKTMGPVVPVMYALIVTKASESASQINYDIQLPLVIDAISEPFELEGVKTATIRYKYPMTRNLGGGAAMVMEANAQCIDVSSLEQKPVVFVPLGINKSYSNEVQTWTANLPTDAVTTIKSGTVTCQWGNANKFTYVMLRMPIGSITGDDMWVSRLEPQVELTSDNIPEGTNSCFYEAQLSFPIALSRDGADLFFMCYKYAPIEGHPEIPPVLSFSFCKLSDVYTPVSELEDHFLLAIGPEAY